MCVCLCVGNTCTHFVLFMFLYEEWLAYWACYPIFVVSFPMIVTLYFPRPPIVLLAAERRGSVYFTSSKRTEHMKESLKISNSSLSRLHCAITFIEHYLKLQFKEFFFFFKPALYITACLICALVYKPHFQTDVC